MKTLSMVVGAAILFTTAHVTILATGGYGGSHAYITLAVAAGVAVASILVGRAWGEGAENPGSLAWSIAIAAGEVYALIGTAERLTAAREASQAPLRQAVEARQKLEAKVAKAEAAVAALPETSARFREAMETQGRCRRCGCHQERRARLRCELPAAAAGAGGPEPTGSRSSEARHGREPGPAGAGGRGREGAILLPSRLRRHPLPLPIASAGRLGCWIW